MNWKFALLVVVLLGFGSLTYLGSEEATATEEETLHNMYGTLPILSPSISTYIQERNDPVTSNPKFKVEDYVTGESVFEVGHNGTAVVGRVGNLTVQNFTIGGFLFINNGTHLVIK